jgi:CBS domain-containing protein
MSSNWASPAFAGAEDVFETLHSGLTVKLIVTPRHELRTCARDELISEVLDANTAHFDFIPVVENSSQEAHFIGLFHASKHRVNDNIHGPISSSFLPLAEESLIGADASILDFVVWADRRPCRLVVSGSRIIGLVTLSDLQRLPVRAALFALITGFEMTMTDYIKAELPNDDAWIAMLKPQRAEKIQMEMSTGRERDTFVDTLLYAQFCDKAEIVRRLKPNGIGDTALAPQLRRFERLRNSIAHANEYAASPDQATDVCNVVRELLAMRSQLRQRLLINSTR